VHISHGDSVVYMVAPAYEDAGSRPLDSMADISAWILTCMLQVMFSLVELGTYVERRAAFLQAHVVALAKDGAVVGDQAGTDGHAAFRGALFGFGEGGEEAWVCFGHDAIEW